MRQVSGLGAPARRALAAAGYHDLASLDGVDHAHLAALHGVGERGLERLQAALLEAGMSLGGEVPAPEVRTATFTVDASGPGAKDIQTAPTGQAAAAYVEQLTTPRRVVDGRLLLELFNRVTGEEPVMWGPSMIGYGRMHYAYATGREGDTFRVGFSPRKAKLSLYGMPHDAALRSRLGKHTTGASCLYVNKPEDIDLGVLEEMIRRAWDSGDPGC